MPGPSSFAASLLLASLLPAALAQQSDCYTAGTGPGCTNPSCEANVCAVDDFCCTVEWDGICAGEALDLCLPPCSVADGGGLSGEYPCNCGAATCMANEICSSAANQCLPVCSPTSNNAPCQCGGATCEVGEECVGEGDPVCLPICVHTDGLTTSPAYPCVCGADTCEDGELCNPALENACAPAQCSVKDGSALSEAYPCTCKDVVCTEGERCDFGEDPACVRPKQPTSSPTAAPGDAEGSMPGSVQHALAKGALSNPVSGLWGVFRAPATGPSVLGAFAVLGAAAVAAAALLVAAARRRSSAEASAPAQCATQQLISHQSEEDPEQAAPGE